MDLIISTASWAVDSCPYHPSRERGGYDQM